MSEQLLSMYNDLVPPRRFLALHSADQQCYHRVSLSPVVWYIRSNDLSALQSQRHIFPRESTNETELTYPTVIQDYLCTDISRADQSLSQSGSLFPADLKIYEQEDVAADDNESSHKSIEGRRPKPDRPRSAVPFSLHPKYVPRKHLEDKIRDMLSVPGARVALVGLHGAGCVVFDQEDVV
jgi:hypothetical protein